MRAYDSLRRRGDFARVTRRGRRSAGTHLTCFVADGRRRSRVGITVAATVGNAVVRNRTRRRMKEAARLLMKERLPTGHDLVLIGRDGTRKRSFAALQEDLRRALKKAGVR